MSGTQDTKCRYRMIISAICPSMTDVWLDICLGEVYRAHIDINSLATGIKRMTLLQPNPMIVKARRELMDVSLV